jgi:hypothetical protein
MGEGTPGVTETENPEQLARDVEGIRDDMTDVVREIDRRRHELLDWRQQLRKHAVPVGIGVIAVASTVGAVAAVAVRRRRQRDRLARKMAMVRDALARMIAHPENVARPAPSVGRSAVSTAASVLVGALAKTVVQRAMER